MPPTGLPVNGGQYLTTRWSPRAVCDHSSPMCLVVAPHEPKHQGVEDGQESQPHGWVEGHPVDLVDDEGSEEEERERIGPSLVPPQPAHHDQLGDPMGEEVDGT